MIGAHGRVPVFAYRRPVDLRKGFEGLSALVREALAQDPLSARCTSSRTSGGRRRRCCTSTAPGLGLYIKRLARGRFAALWDDDCTAACR
jgi:transposase